jgi:hypothetical protein
MYLALKNALGKSFVLFSGLLNKFSGATAAYSLRNLSNTYGGPIVKVRRATDQEEEEFNSYEVNQIEDWVNGKQETTLPANVASSAAAYSLRKVNSSYSGDVVRIRRTSDNVEVNVGFDSDDKVSTSSPITNTTEQGGEIGSTTATTLGAFLNEDVIVYSSDYSSGVDSWSFSGGSLSAPESIGGEDNALKVTRSGDGFFFPQKTGVLVDGETYSITIKLYVPSSNTNPNLSFNVREAGGGPTVVTNLSQSDAWETFTVSLTAGAGNQVVQVTSNNVSMTGGDVFYIKDFVATQTSGNTATVHTWYDQSGNGKDAPQDASGEQPKIASNGALLSDGILFDGDNDGLNMPTDLISSINSASAFVVAKAVETDSSRVALALSRNDPDFRFYLPAIVSSNFNFGYGTSATAISLGAANTTEHLFSATAGSSTAEAFLDGASKGTVSSLDGKSALTADGIGGINSSTFWSGNIKEIIIYASDQSSNRFKIESNINNYYGIYIASNDGFVSKWYDQSGNSNHATQTSTDLQPQIVTSGSLNTVNGKPSIKWDGVDDFMVASISGFKDITNLSSFHVVTPADAAAADTSTMTAFSFGVIASGTNRSLGLASATGAPGISGETITLIHESSGATTGRLASTSYSRASNTQSLLSLFNLSSGTSLFAQGSSVTLNLSNQINTSSDTSPSAAGFTSNNNVYLGGLFTTTPVALEEESFQEIIFFDANKTSDRTSIESNIDDYYDII